MVKNKFYIMASGFLMSKYIKLGQNFLADILRSIFFISDGQKLYFDKNAEPEIQILKLIYCLRKTFSKFS